MIWIVRHCTWTCSLINIFWSSCSYKYDIAIDISSILVEFVIKENDSLLCRVLKHVNINNTFSARVTLESIPDHVHWAKLIHDRNKRLNLILRFGSKSTVLIGNYGRRVNIEHSFCYSTWWIFQSDALESSLINSDLTVKTI